MISACASEVFNFHCFPKPFPHPVDSKVVVYGIDVEGIRLFKSAMAPARIKFFTDCKSAQIARAKYQPQVRTKPHIIIDTYLRFGT